MPIYSIRFQRRRRQPPPPPLMIHQIIIIWTIKLLLLLCYLLPSLHASKMNPLSQPKPSISTTTTTTTTTTHSASMVDKDDNRLEKSKEEEEEELLQKSSKDDDTFAQDLLWKEAKFDITQKSSTKKRLDYLSWDDYFMSIAFLSSQRSKDPERQRGACIVDAENRIVGIGYNGFPRGCHDDILPWASSSHHNQDNTLHTKHPFLCDAEVNAILNKCSQDVKNATIYTHDFPGNDSAKMIIQSGINKVVYLYNHNADHSSKKASRIMFQMANIQTRQYKPTCTSFELDFGPTIDPKINHTIKSTTTTENQQSSTNNVLPTTTATATTIHRDLVFKEAGYDPQTAASVRKRVGYLSWDDYFMSVAFLSAKRSKDPSTQVGACIVNTDKCIIGIGYNGFPRGCSDEHLPWSRSGESMLHTKYPFVVHAEVNAILNKCSADVKGASLYVALFPCNDCAKVIIQSGIKEVIYLSDKYHDSDQCRASRIMFQLAGVKLRQYIPTAQTIQIVL